MPVALSELMPVYTVEEDGENYRRLLGAARQAALEIVKTPSQDLTEAAKYIHKASEDLLARAPAEDRVSLSSAGAIFECLGRLVAVWPDIVAGRIKGEQALASEPGLWKRAMTEWPMGGFAQMTADFMIERNLLGGKVIELGAGVGSCSALVAGHGTDRFVRSDMRPFRPKRRRVAGTVERYDFNEPGPWTDVDTIFATNALHCAQDKVAPLRHLPPLLRGG